MTTTVACVIPNLNGAAWMARCLRSAFAQMRAFDEIIVVDGCSADDSWQVFADTVMAYNESEEARRAYPCPTVIWTSQMRRGIARARNTGVEYATSEWIVQLDVDDWIEPNYVLHCLREASPDVGVVAPALRWPDGRVQYPVEPITAEALLTGNRLFACSMYRRAAWEQVGGYDVADDLPGGLRTYDDWEFWLRVCKAGWKVSVVREPLFHYCPQPTGNTARVTPAMDAAYKRYILEKHGAVLA